MGLLTRARTQLLLIVLYGLTGVLAILAPGLTATIFAISDADQSASVLFLVRIFGTSAILAALLLFFFLINESASRRLMLVLAIDEVVIIGATLLSYVADDVDGQTTAIVVAGSTILGLLNLWGGLIAKRGSEEREQGVGKPGSR